MKGLLVIERPAKEWLDVGQFVPATLEQMADMIDGRVSYISRTQLNRLDSVAQIRVAYTPVRVLGVDQNTTNLQFLGIGEAYTDCLQVDAEALYSIADIDEMFYEVVEGAFANWLECLDMCASVGNFHYEPSIETKRQLVETKPVGVCYEVIDGVDVMTFHFLAIINNKIDPDTFTESYEQSNCILDNVTGKFPDETEEFTAGVVVSHNALLFKHLASINVIEELALLNL